MKNNKVHFPKPLSEPKFVPGDKVILQHEKHGSKEAEEFGLMVGREYGVIVATWWDTFLGIWDCWIAFYGKRGFPKNPANTKPYILKYSEDSLTRYKK